MRERRYFFLRLTALLMIVIGVLAMLAGLIFGIIIIASPRLLLGDQAPVDTNSRLITGGIIIVGGLVGGLVTAAMGQLYQVILELLMQSRRQSKALLHIAKNQ